MKEIKNENQKLLLLNKEDDSSCISNTNLT